MRILHRKAIIRLALLTFLSLSVWLLFGFPIASYLSSRAGRPSIKPIPPLEFRWPIHSYTLLGESIASSSKVDWAWSFSFSVRAPDLWEYSEFERKVTVHYELLDRIGTLVSRSPSTNLSFRFSRNYEYAIDVSIDQPRVSQGFFAPVKGQVEYVSATNFNVKIDPFRTYLFKGPSEETRRVSVRGASSIEKRLLDRVHSGRIVMLPISLPPL